MEIHRGGLFENLEKTMLHTPFYDVRTRAFCGPTAMSAITGIRISVIRDAIRKASGQLVTSDGRAFPVMGVDPKDLTQAMADLGWLVEETVETENHLHSRRDAYTMEDFYNDHGKDGPFIVNVTGHYIAFSHGEVCDTYTKLPMPYEKWLKRKRGRWVKRWWKFAYVPE